MGRGKTKPNQGWEKGGKVQGSGKGIVQNPPERTLLLLEKGSHVRTLGGGEGVTKERIS